MTEALRSNMLSFCSFSQGFGNLMYTHACAIQSCTVFPQIAVCTRKSVCVMNREIKHCSYHYVYMLVWDKAGNTKEMGYANYLKELLFGFHTMVYPWVHLEQNSCPFSKTVFSELTSYYVQVLIFYLINS